MARIRQAAFFRRFAANRIAIRRHLAKPSVPRFGSRLAPVREIALEQIEGALIVSDNAQGIAALR